MKLCAMDIFAETSFGIDLCCCSSLQLTPVARAFDYLTDDYTRRLNNLLKPTSIFYWLPTAANYRHARERNIIRSFVTSTVSARRQEIEVEKNRNDDATRAANTTSEQITKKSDDNSERTTASSNKNCLLTYVIKAVDEKPYEGDDAESSNEAMTDVLMTL